MFNSTKSSDDDHEFMDDEDEVSFPLKCLHRLAWRLSITTQFAHKLLYKHSAEVCYIALLLALFFVINARTARSG